MMSDVREEALKGLGFDSVKYYSLINNYGYTFISKGIKYDLRRWLNCYGCDVDYWSLDGRDIESGKYVNVACGTFKTFEDVIEYLKTKKEVI